MGTILELDECNTVAITKPAEEADKTLTTDEKKGWIARIWESHFGNGKLSFLAGLGVGISSCLFFYKPLKRMVLGGDESHNHSSWCGNCVSMAAACTTIVFRNPIMNFFRRMFGCAAPDSEESEDERDPLTQAADTVSELINDPKSLADGEYAPLVISLIIILAVVFCVCCCCKRGKRKTNRRRRARSLDNIVIEEGFGEEDMIDVAQADGANEMGMFLSRLDSDDGRSEFDSRFQSRRVEESADRGESIVQAQRLCNSAFLRTKSGSPVNIGAERRTVTPRPKGFTGFWPNANINDKYGAPNNQGY